MRQRKENLFTSQVRVLLKTDRNTTTLEGFAFPMLPRSGDILQWNGTRYHISHVVFHQKEGFAPCIELISDWDDEIFCWEAPIDKAMDALPNASID